MILAKVEFGRSGSKEEVDLEDLIESYLSLLFHNGQLCGEYFVTWTNRVLNAHVLLAGPTAYHLRYHSDYSKQALVKVRKAFGKDPAWTLLDDDARNRSPSWRAAPFLYLFTHAFDWAPPVCRGDNGAPIPSYLLPVPYEQKEQLYFWQRNYYHHDNIWLASGALEIPAYRQLVEPKSNLAEHGRELCREIENCTGVPTYYFLMRYWGRRKGEENRRCPGCGHAWRDKRRTERKAKFWEFPLLCEECRLVSHIAVSFDDDRHARIGEQWQRGMKSK